MSVKIRLKRLGKKRSPHYRIVVADSRTKRDGRVIEEIGKYHPTADPSVIEVVSERAQYWLSVGAQPTEQVLALLKLTGDWGLFRGEKGAKSTVKVAEPKEAFVADEKKKPVLTPKAEKAEKADKAEKPEKAEKAEKPEKAEPADKPEEAETAADAPVTDAEAEAPSAGTAGAPDAEAASDEKSAEADKA